MQLRGTYRIERRLLEDPLQPYIAPIRCLPSFHIPIEYSVNSLPVHLPTPNTIHPHLVGKLGWGASCSTAKIWREVPAKSEKGTNALGVALGDTKRRKRIRKPKKEKVADASKYKSRSATGRVRQKQATMAGLRSHTIEASFPLDEVPQPGHISRAKFECLHDNEYSGYTTGVRQALVTEELTLHALRPRQQYYNLIGKSFLRTLVESLHLDVGNLARTSDPPVWTCMGVIAFTIRLDEDHLSDMIMTTE
ncbi:hypothetical protein BDZ91DRAFT_758812 [Kalaharituber pfeilii]|nr:hypothetical protein BDZ91DRAFT_758812 [Kalaharituber pfeilii]